MDETNKVFVAEYFTTTDWLIKSIHALFKKTQQNEEKIGDLTSCVQTMATSVSQKSLPIELAKPISEIHELLMEENPMHDDDEASECKEILLVLFITEISDIHDDDENEVAGDTFDLVYIKLMENTKDHHQHTLFNERIKILSTYKVKIRDEYAFAKRLRTNVDDSIRKKDRALLPMQLYRTYSIRSFYDYKGLNGDVLESAAFVKSLFSK